MPPAARTAKSVTRPNRDGDGDKNGKRGVTVPVFDIPSLFGPERRDYTPYLAIRTMVGDYGARPLPSNIVSWESPDVWVLSPLGVNQPVVGQPNSVYARVNNFGLQQANGVVVKFWWANPSIGALTEFNSNLIGVGYADIPARQSAIVPCPSPWVPIEENGGHECLLAEAYIPLYDPPTAPPNLYPIIDRHVGQKNEQLIGAQPGSTFELSLEAGNAAPLRQPIAIDVAIVATETLPALFNHRSELRDVTLEPPRAALPVQLQLPEPPGRYMTPSDGFARALSAATLANATGSSERAPAPWITRTLELDPWESTAIEIAGSVPRNAVIGQTFMFRVSERIGPVTIGGYTIGVLVA